LAGGLSAFQVGGRGFPWASSRKRPARRSSARRA